MSDLVHVNKQHIKKQAKEEGCMYQMWNCIFIFNKWDGEEILYLKKKKHSEKRKQSRDSVLRWACQSYCNLSAGS